jgi:hypothetical protein
MKEPGGREPLWHCGGYYPTVWGGSRSTYFFYFLFCKFLIGMT